MEVCHVKGCGRPLYCGSLCSRHYNRLRTTGTTDDGPRAKRPFAERLWSQIEKRGPKECWPWIGKSTVRGYGTIGRGGRDNGKVLAHRAVWEITKGQIPDNPDLPHGYVIRHTCDNRLCCNPAHLEIGTQGDNVRDMDVRGRRVVKSTVGSAHPNSVLTEADVLKIRALPLSIRELSRRFGVSRHCIKRIRTRRGWKHI